MTAQGAAHPGEPMPALASSGAASRARPLAAGIIALVGMGWIAGWATDSSLVWLAWLAIGAVAGLVAGSSRAIWVLAPAAALVYVVAALSGRAGSPIPQPDLTAWIVLVLVGAMVTGAGFAMGAAIAGRRVSRITVAALLAGVAGAVFWVGYSGYVGSNEVLDAPTSSHSCENPGSAFGWPYEAINYDPADDARLAAAPGGLDHCTSQGSPAGTEVVSPDGVGIDGWYIPAASGAGPTAPTIVIAPGWKANKSEMLKYAPAFHDRFNLVIVDLRNQGRSGGDMTTFGYKERLDVRAVIDWLEKTKQPSWIGGMGVSMGAATMTNAAVDDSRIRALILDSMHARVQDSFADGIAHERNLPGLPTAWAVIELASMRSGLAIRDVDPVNVIGRLGDRPVLLIHGTGDTDDTVDHAAEPNLAAANAAGVPVSLQLCQGGRHGQLVDTCPDAWRAWVDAFLASVPDLPRDSN
jgi:hypothetical protein